MTDVTDLTAAGRARDGTGQPARSQAGGDADSGTDCAPPADHDLSTLVCRISGTVTEHSARLLRLEYWTDDLAEVVDQLETAFTASPAGSSADGPDPSPGPGVAAEPSSPAVASPVQPPGPPDLAPDLAPDDRRIGLDMRRLVVWVGDNVATLLERKVPQTGGSPYWCRRWWLHPEAIARFEAVRRCWVDAVGNDGAAMVVYFEHLDAMLGVLCAENGPFCGCTAGVHSAASNSTTLGHDEPGEDYFLSFDRLAAAP